MANVIVAFSRQENARNIRNILVKSGFHVVSVCTSGAQILSAAEELDRGVVVGGGKFPDMVYGEVCRMLPEEFSTLFESAVVTGRASMVEDEAQKVEVLRAICQKYAASNMHNFEREVARSLHRTGICKIEIESVTGKAKRTPRE